MSTVNEKHTLLPKSPQPTEPRNQGPENRVEDVTQFFLFICASTAIRSFEAGIVASMMSDIQSDLSLDYKDEGTIAASPDYGITVGALLAILVYRYHSHQAQYVLSLVMIGTSLATWTCCLYPCMTTLVFARAFGGFLWSHAATHYPVWIDRRGHSKTIWLACTNVSLLTGILGGYVVGGAVRTMATETSIVEINWITLYFIEGLLMAICGVVLVFGFDPELVSIQTGVNDNDSSLSQLILSLLHSASFILAVSITGCISSGVVFALYFITQVCEARGMTLSQAAMMVTAVFVTAPAPGMLLGSWCVSKMGGYTDHVVTFGLAFVSASVVLVSTFLFSLSWDLWGESSQLVFALACWFFFSVGAMPGPPLNGVAVSVLPQASHVASGLQFALANASKIVVPQIGGFICDRLGLIDGFNDTMIACAVVLVALSWTGLVCARRTASREGVGSAASR